MSVDVTNETVWNIDPEVFSQLGVWVMSQMRVSIQSDLTILFVDPDPIAQLHERWMNLQGPTDVMSFPMDELRPGDGSTEMEGVLGDIVICPWVARQQALAAGHSTMQEMMLLTIHGILHLLGYDHVTPEQERQMFGLQRQLLLTYMAVRQVDVPSATLPSGARDMLVEYDAGHARPGAAGGADDAHHPLRLQPQAEHVRRHIPQACRAPRKAGSPTGRPLGEQPYR